MFCTTTALLVAGSLAILATDSRRVLDELHRQDPQLAERGISDHEILVIGYVAGSVVLLWSLVAAVLAALAFRGRRRAWHALLASTAAVVLLGLVAMLGSALVVVPVTAAVVTVVLLVRPEVRRWFSG
jgi:hypothetical protein